MLGFDFPLVSNYKVCIVLFSVFRTILSMVEKLDLGDFLRSIKLSVNSIKSNMHSKLFKSNLVNVKKTS